MNDISNNQNAEKIQEDIYMVPEEREIRDSFTLDELHEKVILTPKEVEEMNGRFPFKRIGHKEINGELVQIIEELYRYDAAGRLVRNDDVTGISWKGDLIPHDRFGECPDHYEKHGARQVFLGVDGFKKFGTVLCSECQESYEKELKWEERCWGFFFKAKQLKEAIHEKQGFQILAGHY